MRSKDKIVDIREKSIDTDVLSVLLKDRTTGKNILWCTNDYENIGDGYGFSDTLEVKLIRGKNDGVIKPRVEKDKVAQELRSKEKAEVFTPSWVCNVQNNLVDDAWFGSRAKRFNTEKDDSWVTNYYPISFSRVKDKSWQDYVRATRMEVCCGEAPYLTSRYDTVSGKYITVKSRIGLFDRKLRVISENADNMEEWIKWAKIAVQNIYGFDWQGDNIILARENVLYAVIESFYDLYKTKLDKEILLELAEIISWNIWQMDGIKYVVPNSCKPIQEEQIDLFGDSKLIECPGCKNENQKIHTGDYCIIKDWETNEKIKFIDLMKGVGE